ncbi:cell adhesion molecule 3-like isoform X2 [Saccostrea echinata]|uniref:cell adhesion molecule 3-like isoform X2 n=1 Tax=Saccostrea echinata TaxID=191078 RepID=UPI002A8386D5|nr:cell adhesion molecule 3-like isoform X2 [Saccostrea echinata]
MKNMDLFRSLSFILFLSVINYQGSIAGTVSTAGSLTATIGGSVDFTCTYTLESGDTVYPGLISWQAKTGQGDDGFSNIATFSPPGQGSNSFANPDYKNRSELFNVTASGANSYDAVMRLNEVMCLDEKHYRCQVFFATAAGPSSKTKETSLTVRAPAEQPYDIPVPVPDNIEENIEVTFSCTANVGKPPGQIKWWRYRKGITAPQEMSTGVSANTPQVQEAVCIYNVTSTITYTMTKDDDQSVWRCFVDNELLTMPDRDKPNQESKRVNVFFKVNVPRITKVPDTGDSSQYSVGSSVTLICEAEGNPTPGIHTNTAVNRYLWTFRASPNDNTTELTSNNGTLTLTNLQETDTGTYMCTAFNGFNGKFFNASKDLSLQIGSTGRPTPATQGKDDGGLGAGPIAGIVIGVIIVLIIIFLAVWCICKRRQSKEDSIDEPPEKPIRNNQDLTFVNRPDIVNNDKNSPFYAQEKKQYNNDLQYADLTFDDKPRSRKPIQIYDTNGLNSNPYSDTVMMPSV